MFEEKILTWQAHVMNLADMIEKYPMTNDGIIAAVESQMELCQEVVDMMRNLGRG